MKKEIPIPLNEKERLEALQAYDILDTLPENEFDAITRVASYIAGTKIALISLIDKDRQWFKSDYGLGATETPRDISFCQYAIMDDSVFEVTDASTHDTFKDNPLVTGDPNIKFYAGFPLKTPQGFNIGTLCVIDPKANKLTDEQISALSDLSLQVISNLELRKVNANYKLKDSQNSQFFNVSLDLIAIAGMDGYFKKLNPKWTAVLGYDIEELLKNPFADLIHPDDVEKTFKEIEKLGNGGVTVNFICRFKKKSGEYLHLSWSAAPNIELGLMFCVARDITKSLADEKLRTAELTAIDASVLRVELSTERKIISCNHNFLDLVGYEEAEITGMPHLMLLNGKVDENYESFWRTLNSGNAVSGEFERLTKNGKIVWIKGAYLPVLNDDGEVDKIVKLAYDVTERKMAEVLLAKRNEELDQFSYVVSHDLKAPLRAIATLSQFLKEDLEGQLDGECKKNFDLIISRTKRMEQLIDDILNYSKLGKSKVSTSLVDSKKMLSEICADLNLESDKFEINLNGEFPSFVVKSVFLRQVMSNVISNAIKYNDKEYGTLNVSCEQSPNKFEFKFTDNGPGIQPEYHGKIFEIFQTIHGEKRDDSTGIGLATVKKLMDELNGTVKVISDGAHGCTFVLSLPRL